jgi:hypothetical protein
VNGEHPVEISGRQIDEPRLLDDPRIVDEHIAVAECGPRESNERGDVVLARHVAGLRFGGVVLGDDFLRHRLGARAREIVDDHPHAVARKTMSDRAPDARPRSGDNGDVRAHQLSSWMATRLARWTESVIKIA